MSIRWMLLGALALAPSAWAETCTVNARLTNIAVVPPLSLYQAKATAAAIFAGIGVSLQWQGAQRHPAHPPACWEPVEIRLEAGEPDGGRPDSMAYAMPYQAGGTRIRVFAGRVASGVPSSRMGAVLGHVLAHEISHLLQGVDRHSDRGLMKARWDAADFRAMRDATLPFDALDVELIKAAAKNPPGDTASGAVAAANF